MDLFLIAAMFVAAAANFILLGHFARPAPKGEDDARKTFASLPDFDPGEVHAKDGAAISYDPVRNVVTIWDKSGGARLVDPGGVSGWRSEPQVELYSPANDRKPFFSVAVISGSDRAAWRDRLQAAFGGEKEVRS
jgi:hypothetical protein